MFKPIFFIAAFAAAVLAGPASAAEITLSAVDAARRAAGARADLYSVSVPVSIGPKESTWSSDGNNDLWRETIVAADTDKIGIYAPSISLPVGATITLATSTRTDVLKGAAIGKKLSTPLMPSNRISVELRVPAGTRQSVRFMITKVDVTPRSPTVQAKAAPTGCVDNINYECKRDTSNEHAAQATGAILIRVSNSTELCTGTLINPIGGGDVNYFLTATHCRGTEEPLEFRVYWNASASCGDPTFATMSYQGFANSVSDGATLVASYHDVSLYKLDTVPAEASAWRAGFDASPTPSGNTFFGVHHAYGAGRQWVKDSDGSLLAANYVSVGPSWYVASDFAHGDGVTGSGSSGSALFDSSQRVVGALYGGEVESCSNYQDGVTGSVYSALWAAWDGGGTPTTSLKPWLDPNNTGAKTNTGAAVATVNPVDGACGTAQGVDTQSFPADGLCSVGTATPIDTAGSDGSYNWTCVGTDGGTTASCSAPKVTPVNGTCGSANGVGTTAYPTSGLCATGTHSSLDTTGSDGSFNWLCSGSNGGTSESCTAPKLTPVDGSCGSASGTTTSTFPSGGLCAEGSPTATDTSGTDGQFNWTCSGTNGGATASCAATVQITPPTPPPIEPTPVDGACGGASGVSTSVYPSVNLCASGSATATDTIAGDGQFNWTCSGSNGGATTSCAAPLATTPLPSGGTGGGTTGSSGSATSGDTGSGGGAFDLLSLLGLLGCVWVRRRT